MNGTSDDFGCTLLPSWPHGQWLYNGTPRAGSPDPETDDEKADVEKARKWLQRKIEEMK